MRGPADCPCRRAHHMFFHGTLGQAHDLGNVGVLAAVDAVEQKDLPGALGQTAQRSLDMTQVIAGFEGRLGLHAKRVLLFRQPAFAQPAPGVFAAQVIDGDVAGAAQQIRAEFLDLHQRPPPEPQEQVLHQVGRRRPTPHPPTDQGLHLRALGQEHLEKMCAAARAVTAVGLLWFRGYADHPARLAYPSANATSGLNSSPRAAMSITRRGR